MRKLVLVVLAIAVVQYWDEMSEFYFSPPPAKLRTDLEVIMFGAQWCGYCAEARKLFRSKGVPFREFDIEQSASAREQFESLGGRGVPLIVIDQQVIRGFNKRRILAALSGRRSTG